MRLVLAALLIISTLTPPAPGWTRAQLEAVVTGAATRYGVSARELLRVADCETGGTWNPHARGDQGRSWGLLQFYCRDESCQGSLWQEMHPGIEPLPSRDDPEMAADAAARAFADGKASRWSCWRRIYEGRP